MHVILLLIKNLKLKKLSRKILLRFIKPFYIIDIIRV